jgi:hypothetical protein
MRGRYGVVFARFRLLGRHDMACAAVSSARVWGMHVSYWHQRLKVSRSMVRLGRRLWLTKNEVDGSISCYEMV